jgi:putative spermidine/putrescine transport system permease protein
LLALIVRSFFLAITAAIVAIIIALPCAFVIQRGQFRGRDLLETWITGPRMIPQIVLALALLAYFETVGLAETFIGLVIAHLVITIPFAFRTLLVSVATMDKRLEWSSDSRRNASSDILGRDGATAQGGLIAAFIFTFILSFNVTLALFLSGLGSTRSEMFQRMNVGMTPVIPAISFVLALAGSFVHHSRPHRWRLSLRAALIMIVMG